MRSRKLLALIFSLLAIAPALAGYMTLLGAGVGSIQPVASWVSTTDPTFPSTSLTYSGPSLSTMFDSTGKLTYAPNNLLTYSNTFSNAAWTKSSMSVASGATDPFGTSFAWTLTATANGALLYQLQSLAGPNAIPYVWMRRKTGSGIIYLRNANNVSIDVTAQVSSSWALVYVAPTAALGSNLFLISLATNGDQIEIYSAGYSAVTYETTPRAQDRISTGASAYYGPRIDYDPVTLAVKGLLIEEARTNVLIQSNGFATAPWGSAGHVTTGSAAATSPDGTTNAWLLTHDGTAAQSLFQASTLGAGTYTETFYAKRGNNDWVFIELYNATDGDMVAWFNLANGTVGTQTKSTGVIQSIGGGWYRLSITVVPTVANSSLVAPTTVSANGSFTRVAASTVYVFGGQVEAGSFATSYIPTAAASVTRAADVVQFTGAALTAFGGVAGSSIVEHTALSTYQSGTSRIIGTTTGRAPIFIAANNQVGTYNGTNLLYATPGSGGLFSTTVRTGAAWSAAGRSIVANGGTVGTDANSMFGGVAPVTANLGSDVGSSNWGSGWYKSFAIYNQRLPDATLQAKSVVGASYAANDNGLRFADNDNLPVHWRVAL